MELDCRQCDEGLVEFLYGEVDERRAAAFEQHLRRCPKCATLAEQLGQTRSALACLEWVEPPPLTLDDPILLAAQAKAEQLATSAERIAGAGAEQASPSAWARLGEWLRGAAMRPALGTAFLVVLVAGVGLFFLSEMPAPRSAVSARSGETALSAVPSAEVAVSATPTFEPSEAPRQSEEAELEQAQAPVPRETPEEELTPAVAQTAVPRRPLPRREVPTKALPRVEARGLNPAPTREPAQNRTTSAGAGRSDWPVQSQLEGSAGERTSPIVVEAQQAPAGVTLLAPAAPAATARAPLIPTPPLPQAGSSRGQEQQQQTQRASGTSGGAVQQPTRVTTPGQEQYNRGVEAYRSGRYRDAAEELNEFVRSPSAPGHLVPSGLHTLALSQQQSGNLSAAARTYDQLLRGHGGYQRRPQALLEAAQVAARLGQHARAEALLGELGAIPGWSSRAQSELVRLQHRRAGEDGPLGPERALDAVEELAPAEAAPAAQPSEAY